jgi:hypothetical protein
MTGLAGTEAASGVRKRSSSTSDRGWYNGYRWSERIAKLKELKRLLARGDIGPATGPCDLCGDPDVPVEYHDEDYSQPYVWTSPALFALCRNCHRDKLHKRFERPFGWPAFVAHVRRGGYARDRQDPVVKKEVALCQAALERGESFQLRGLRPYQRRPGEEWFTNLRVDRHSRLDAAARARP